jgi:hypothetical protein
MCAALLYKAPHLPSKTSKLASQQAPKKRHDFYYEVLTVHVVGERGARSSKFTGENWLWQPHPSNFGNTKGHTIG